MNITLKMICLSLPAFLLVLPAGPVPAFADAQVIQTDDDDENVVLREDDDDDRMVIEPDDEDVKTVREIEDDAGEIVYGIPVERESDVDDPSVLREELENV